MEIEVSAKDLKTCKADERGRINLGTEFGGKEVVVAVVEVEEDDG